LPSCHDSGKITEPVDEPSCQGFDITPWNCAKQKEFKQFIVGHGCRTTIKKSLTETGAVILDIAWKPVTDRNSLSFVRFGGLGKRKNVMKCALHARILEERRLTLS